ncbi:hypothetical protein LSH36_72g05019 [Paralvinella palmiformis]|uniref:F-actin monooxygenase n=1 Tax=Paralvinella palmiformis TaxID=53620 RepID=A0AAD9K4F1_9ANNE|nr:hypothetical protein LSH36_72g05019 [Paralvinella palmiformis]
MSIYQLAMDLGGEEVFQRDIHKKEEAGSKIPFFRYEDQKEAIPRHAATLGSYNNATCANDNDPVAIVFEQFCSANTFQGIMTSFQQLCDLAEEKPRDHGVFYHRLKQKVLIIGGGPCGLRTGIEVALLGGKAVILEKRDRFSRNNVLHLWPYLIHDLKALGAKKFFGKFCAGSIDHISIRALECILLKVALLVGVEIHPGVTYLDLEEPVVPKDEDESRGWRAKTSPPDHPASEFEFDVLIGADGKRNTLRGFRRKEFRGKLAIAITANFINRNTQAEASVEEISGVAFIFNQKFFKDLNAQTGIDLENIVYYKDDTHYFVMTAKKHSLLLKGVLMQDFDDPALLLAKENVNQEALLAYAVEAADVSTRHRLPNLEFAHNHFGQPDVAMFDFTSMFAAEHASRVMERHGYRLLECLVGDSLLEPFWPTGSGCARGFMGSLDAAWMIRSWASGKMTPLEVLAERESAYQLLSQTTPENVNKNFAMYTIDPSTRYVNLNPAFFKPQQVKSLYDGGDEDYLNEIVRIAEQKSSRYEMIRDSHNLLRWFQRQLESYRHIVKVLDLSASWQNGLALCALIHKYRPELIDVRTLDHSKVTENNQLICGSRLNRSVPVFIT